MSGYNVVRQNDYAEEASPPGSTKPDSILFDGVVVEAGHEASLVTESERVRVVAPCGLPPSYLLPVKTSDGRAFDVRVPETGAVAGQAFEAERFAPEPVKGRFSSDLCGCGGEGLIFGVACCCSGVAFAALMERLKLDPCGGRQCSGKATFFIFSTIWMVLLITTCVNYSFVADPTASESKPGLFLFNVISFYVFVVWYVVAETRTRMAFRLHYRIPGNCFLDCLSVYFCECCSSLQMYRHMKKSGERPMRFESLVEAEIV
jgi:Cys-rich protein (TIGR01571 family)